MATPTGRSTSTEMVFMAAVKVYCLVLYLMMSTAEAAQLRIGFYSRTCPTAETLIQQALIDAVRSDPGIGADLVRMHFHDCFVRGCDGSILLDSVNGNLAEKNASINQSFEDEAFDVIDSAKVNVEAACPGVVSCADILAFIARDSVAHYGGGFYAVPAGRRDGRISRASESTANLPTENFRLDRLIQNFARKGLTASEMVTLSGAHTIGVAHCVAFGRRIYNSSSSTGVDPTLDPTYAAELRRECPTATTDQEVPMDPPSRLVFDNSYYQGVLRNRGLFTSDQSLLTSPFSAAQVHVFASNSDIFKSSFAAAIVKMGNIGVLTGVNGEIRKNCRVVN